MLLVGPCGRIGYGAAHLGLAWGTALLPPMVSDTYLYCSLQNTAVDTSFTSIVTIRKAAYHSQMSNLHWSVDHSDQTDRWDYVAEFSEPLTHALASPPIDPSSATRIHRYTILPNFWSGFNPHGQDPDLSTGSLSVGRTRSESHWQYHVEHVNIASGEHLTLDFACEDESLRPLRSPWRITAQNTADGAYDAIDWTGSTSPGLDGASIGLTTSRGLSIAAGSAPDPARLTCLWAFVDILPTLNGRSLDRLAILDDLEVLKLDCRAQPLETWILETDAFHHKLQGYTLSGDGLSPCYWWVTDGGDVAAISTMLSTYVLTERGT